MFTNRTAAGADILDALICCSGCQLFVEGGRRHPRRVSFGCSIRQPCVFCGRGFFFRTSFRVQHACSFERCALPQTQISNVGMLCLRHFPLTADASTMTLTIIVGEKCCNVSMQLVAVLMVGLSPHKRKHPNAIRKRRTAFGKMDGTADNARRKRV